MLNSAEHGFSLCPLLTQGAIEALLLRGSDALKQAYLPKMVAGKWTGTMNLTEPQAGSDLALVRTRAEPRPASTTRSSGRRSSSPTASTTWPRTSCTWCSRARPDAPEGVKGISLFIVPKFVPNEDGTPGKRNDVQCASIEHKLGIHASPTAVMVYDKAARRLPGRRGEPRPRVHVHHDERRALRRRPQGVAIAERAYQRALAFAQERLQGRDLVGRRRRRCRSSATPTCAAC